MEETTIETLEFPAIIAELLRHAKSPYGKELAREGVRPLSDIVEIEEGFAELSEVIDFSREVAPLPITELTDLRPKLATVGPPGVFLLAADFMVIRAHIALCTDLAALSSERVLLKYPRIATRFAAFSDTTRLSSALTKVFDSGGEIKDKASSELYGIRKELRGARDRALRLLDRIRGDDKFSGYFQEDFFTLSDDRYALAIKAGFHTRFSGVIHGRSQTGETYFIEPMEIVELNNRQAILKRDEKAEEIKILKALTERVVERRANLYEDIKLIAWFDLAAAKAEFATLLDCVIPTVSLTGGVKLKGARHPLLLLQELYHGGASVTSVDILLEEELSVLVISGANTGGKTVALKTLGLLTMMAACVLPVPLEASSEVRLFDKIFADIGDRQGIEENLSTFSSHIKRLGVFLGEVTSSSLVLIDEIGVGTDPTEGSVFALAVLEELKERGAVTVVTTHINLLKAHAEVDPAFMNASVIFDDKTMNPAYNLIYGVPGASLGLSIAESLGIPESLISRARVKLGSDEGAFIESLKGLESEKIRLKKVSDRLELLAVERDKVVVKLREDRAKILEKIRARATKVLARAEEEIRGIVREFDDSMKAAKIMSKEMPRARRGELIKETRSAISKSAREICPVKAEVREDYIPAEGDRVGIIGTITSGVVTKVNTEEREAELLVGKMKVKARFEKLEKKQGATRKSAISKQEPRPQSRVSMPESMGDVEFSVKVIGMRVEEALKTVTAFIDRAHVEGLARVEVIHGVGTGALRDAIREELSMSPLVKSLSTGEIDGRGGGAGVTIVELS